MTLTTRRPTGRPSWPLVLVEGPEKSGKSWLCAELTASERVGRCLWLDLGEGSADEYGAIPGADYEIVVHDGSFGQILTAVRDAKDIAAKAVANGDKPVVLTIDSMSAEWELLSAIADARARDRYTKRTKGRTIPVDETPQIGMDLWNEVTAKHRKLMTVLMTFPGIVCMTARGKEVAAMGADGKPIEGRRDYKVEGQKTLAYDANVWIRLSREHAPMVVGVRGVRAPIRPGVDKPRELPDMSLEKLLFDVLGVAEPDVRDLVTPKVTPADLAETGEEPVYDPNEQQQYREQYEAEIAKATVEQITEIGKRVGNARKAGDLSQATVDHLSQAAAARRAELNGGGSGEAAAD